MIDGTINGFKATQQSTIEVIQQSISIYNSQGLGESMVSRQHNNQP
jgi:hypothetical protein